MLLSLSLAILAPQIIAFILVCLLWPGQSPIRSHLILKVSLAVGIGFGLLSSLYFLQLLLLGPSRSVLVSTQIALLLLLGAALFWKTRSSKAAPLRDINSVPPPATKLHTVLFVVFIIALVAATVTYIFISLKRPHGE